MTARARLNTASAPWLTPEMLATKEARARFREWRRLGGLETTTLTRAVVRSVGTYLGEDGMVEALVDVIVRLPPPLVHYVCHGCVFAMIGEQFQGLCLEWDRVQRLPPFEYLILLSTTEPDAVAHECAHAWLGLPRQTDPIAAHICHERLAAGLTFAMGFRGPSADPDRCVAEELRYQRRGRAHVALPRIRDALFGVYGRGGLFCE